MIVKHHDAGACGCPCRRDGNTRVLQLLTRFASTISKDDFRALHRRLLMPMSVAVRRRGGDLTLLQESQLRQNIGYSFISPSCGLLWRLPQELNHISQNLTQQLQRKSKAQERQPHVSPTLIVPRELLILIIIEITAYG